MTMQYSTAVRNAMLDAIETTAGTSAKLRLLTGAAPANPAAAQTGTLIIEIALPTDWMAAASGGTKVLAGSWSGAATAAGTAGHYRIVDSAGTTCHEQGSVFMPVTLTTSASSAANSNVLTFTSGAAVAQAGMNAVGTGIPAGAKVLASTATSVTLDMASTAGVGSGVVITFGGDITLDNSNIAVNQVVTINSKNMTAPGA
jgi:hypothetical protein